MELHVSQVCDRKGEARETERPPPTSWDDVHIPSAAVVDVVRVASCTCLSEIMARMLFVVRRGVVGECEPGERGFHGAGEEVNRWGMVYDGWCLVVMVWTQRTRSGDADVVVHG